MKSFVFTISIVLAVIAATLEQGYYLLVSQAPGTVDCERDEWGFRIETPQARATETWEGEIPASFIGFVRKVYEAPSQEKAALIEKAIVKGAVNLNCLEQGIHQQLFRMDKLLRTRMGHEHYILVAAEEAKVWNSLEEIELGRAYVRSNEHVDNSSALGVQDETNSSRSSKEGMDK